MRHYLAAALQVCAGTDKRENLDRAEAMVAAAAGIGAKLVALPEVFSWRGRALADVSGAEPIPGPTTERCAAWARTHKVHLLAGSILEWLPDNPKVYNTSLLFDDAGALIARYRKIHLFDVDLSGRVTIRESAARLSGTEVVTVPTLLGTIGMSVCYDLRFPELYRRLVLAGAEVLCVPSAFTFPTGSAHWESLLRARAIENQVYLIAPDQVGSTPSGSFDFGNSMIVDPWGAILARAPDRETMIVAEVNRDYQERVRRELPCLTHITLRP